MEERRAVLAGEVSPEREDALALLVPLGRLVMEGDVASAAPTVEHLANQFALQEAPWGAVIEGLLTDRAEDYCTRVAALADADAKSKIMLLEILEAFREELEALIQVSAALNAPPSEALETRIRASDEVLEAHLDAR